MEEVSGRYSTLQGRERSVFNQTNIGTVSRATLGGLLRDRRRAYGPFRELRCHLELKLKLKLPPRWHSDTLSSMCIDSVSISPMRAKTEHDTFQTIHCFLLRKQVQDPFEASVVQGAVPPAIQPALLFITSSWTFCGILKLSVCR